MLKLRHEKSADSRYKQAKPYDEATTLLKDLRVAEHQGRLPEFMQRFEKLKPAYNNRPALITRFRTIEL